MKIPNGFLALYTQHKVAEPQRHSACCSLYLLQELGIYLVSDIERQTQSGMWGIREPIPGECGARLKPIELAVILAPGLGFDREGRRCVRRRKNI